ncbi:MAG: TetR/AcrR family transcriptional regulator [Bacteroidota bacterium]
MEDQIKQAIRARREKEKASQTNAILRAARKIAVEEGWTKVSIRKISKEIAYTPPVIYEHFKNKEAILIELESIGFRKLKFELEEVRVAVKEPKEQLEALSLCVWDWAFKNAEVYQVMFNLQGIKSTPPSPNSLKDSAHSTLETLKSLHLFSTETDSLLLNWWALVHGYISLVMSGQLPGKREQTRRELQKAIKLFAQNLSG